MPFIVSVVFDYPSVAAKKNYVTISLAWPLTMLRLCSVMPIFVYTVAIGKFTFIVSFWVIPRNLFASAPSQFCRIASLERPIYVHIKCVKLDRGTLVIRGFTKII